MAAAVANEPDLIHISIAGEITRPAISTRTIRSWIAQRRLKRYSAGRKVYVDRRELLALLERGGGRR